MSAPSSAPPTLESYATELAIARRGEAAGTWLHDATASIRDADDPGGRPLRLALARSSRTLGSDLLAPSVAELDALPESIATRLSSPGWRLLDVGRAALLLAALKALPTDRYPVLLSELLRRGELSEQQSLLRMLPLLPRGHTLVEPAIDACRTNAMPVFGAIALHNPFPARRFPDLNFNQLVLKAMFMGLPVEQIDGLPSRVSAELSRMVLGYASERRAADRSVPSGVQHIVQLAQGQTTPATTDPR